MPISLKEAADALGMIDLYPGRREYFDGLLTDLEIWEIAGAADPSAAIDAYAARLTDHIAGLGDHSGVGGYPGYWVEAAKEFEEAWNEGGFSEVSIREVVVAVLKHTHLFTNEAMKYFVFASFKRRGVMIDELEAAGAHFQVGIWHQDLSILDYLADNADEMQMKRAVDHVLADARYGFSGVTKVAEDRLAAFVKSAEGYECGVFGAVDWLCNDGNQARLGGRYAATCKPALGVYRRLPQYQVYVREPRQYVLAALGRFLQVDD